MQTYTYIFKQLPVDQIERDANQPRIDFGTEGDENRLLVSIKKHGIQQDLVVTELEDDRYRIIDGHRRYICAQKLGFVKVPCRIYPKMSVGELETRRYEIQNNRRQWKPAERADALERIKTAMTFRTHQEVAEHLGMSKTAVANSLQLRKEKMSHIGLMEKYDLSESFRVEFVRLKPKMRKIKNIEVDNIIINIFDRVQHKTIRNAKDLRMLGSIFSRATANEEELYSFLQNPDMTVAELEQHTLQSGFSLNIEKIIREIGAKRQKGIAFSTKEKAFLEQLRSLLNKTL